MGGMLYFMPERQFYAKRFSAWPGWTPARGGVEVPGQAASLLAKTAPALQHHSSLRSGSMDMPIFLKIFISCPSWTTDFRFFRVLRGQQICNAVHVGPPRSHVVSRTYHFVCYTACLPLSDITVVLPRLLLFSPAKNRRF